MIADMRDVIDQFMWAFQQSFRRGLERSVEKVFEELGRPCRVTGYLIGVLQPGGDRHALCVEPEDGTLTPADFAGIKARAEELYNADPESKVYHSVARVHERRHAWARQRAFGAAIREVVEDNAEGALTCFVGLPVVVEQHLVYPVVGVPTGVLGAIPMLTRETALNDHRWRVTPSIAHAAIAELLQAATRALHLPDAGEAAEIGAETGDIVRAAVTRLGRDVVALSGNEFGGSLSDAMTRSSTLRYERRVGIGRVLLAQRDLKGLEVDLTFRRPIRIRETRTLRKLLELSGRGGPSLLTDGDEVYGLGHLNDSYDPASECAFEFVVVGDGTWELRHCETALVTVKYGSPRLPEERISYDRFANITQRVLQGDTEPDVGALWALVLAASEAEHGTMIVVSSTAEAEAERLGNQALPVEPAALRSELLSHLTEIDGAVLVDPKAICHGLGVILDGTAAIDGDRSRGARYNSAVRYLASASSPTVIVIVSEDGMINLLPDLRPQVARASIEALMEDLRAAAAIEPVHAERFYKAFDEVKAQCFYLSAEQCDEASALCADHWKRRRSAGAMIWLTPDTLTPSPSMDDSYFLD